MNSPRITKISWGKMEVKGIGSGRDFKLFPGGGRAWDWKETNTHHVPGIQPEDVKELLENGAEVVVLSRGMLMRLNICPETFKFLEKTNTVIYEMETKMAVTVYNNLASQGVKVAGLFHSTC